MAIVLQLHGVPANVGAVPGEGEVLERGVGDGLVDGDVYGGLGVSTTGGPGVLPFVGEICSKTRPVRDLDKSDLC